MGQQADSSYLPASQNGVQLLQRSLPESQDRLPRRRVVEQVLQVRQRQLRLGLHRLLDAHLPPGAAFLLLLADKSHNNTTAFSLNPGGPSPGWRSATLTPCLGRTSASQSVTSSTTSEAWPQLHAHSSSWP